MTYEEACSISNYLEGSIKCTFARIYYDYGGKGDRADIKHLFSIQNEDISGTTLRLRQENYQLEWYHPTYSMFDTVIHKYDDNFVRMWTSGEGEFREPVFEVRASFKKEVPWGRRKPGMLVRVNIESPVYDILLDFLERSSLDGSIGRDMSYVVDKLRYGGQRLYVKPTAIEWQPMGTDVLEQVLQEEQQRAQDKVDAQKTKFAKSQTNLLLLAAAALLLNKE